MAMWRQTSPGLEAAHQSEQNPVQADRIHRSSLSHGASFEEYLKLPDKNRIGICCSGGGIRSASYAIGALQVMRNAGVMQEAEYLAAVSGGCYTAVAHTLAVATSGGDFPPAGQVLPALDDPSRLAALRELFCRLAPWALNSPEERNLRDKPGYLATGVVGMLWLGANFVYGAVRHLLPFAALIMVLAAATGFTLHRWVHLEDPRTFNASMPAWISLGLVAAAGLFITWRGVVESTTSLEWLLETLRRWATVFLLAALGVLIFLVVLPIALTFLRKVPGLVETATQGRDIDLDQLLKTTGGAAVLMSGLSFLARRAKTIKIAGILAAVGGPLAVAIPYVGLTYWVTLNGLHWESGRKLDPWPLRYALGALVILILFAFVDEVTANMHRFYRARLATIFVPQRIVGMNGEPSLRHAEPPWAIPLYFSDVRPQAELNHDKRLHPARMPNLIVCAAVNLSDAVPPGRNAASFTFERDWSGGPTTGYLPTNYLEEKAGGTVLTLPAMMAISGAALAPSMGHQTKPGLRLLLAMFNVRLGVWLPNPLKSVAVDPYQIRGPIPEDRAWCPEISPPESEEPEKPAACAEANNYIKGGEVHSEPDRPLRRPGLLYVLREALGLNSINDRHVYVSDGGHWDNLGLVELLRRGCSQILCFDAAGGDADKFHTLSNAISLARSDLGVKITINTNMLKPNKDGFSPKDCVRGEIEYPDGTKGTLVYTKAVLPANASPDLIAFREADPKFPRHSTVDQFFNERKYESYRKLGFGAALNAIKELNHYRRRESFEFASGERPYEP